MKCLLLLLAAASLEAATFYLTVGGLGGEPEFETRFTTIATGIDKLVRSGQDVKVETLYGAQATRAKVEAALASIARESKPADALVLMLIGHGSFDNVDYKINLPGPDLTAAELASLLDRIAARQLVVNMTSCSGASLGALRKENRAVITATKTGTEKNATIFARYWLDALRDPAADTDKNEVVSALEAFKYAAARTAQFYDTQKRIATEHPLLEDTGHGDGTRDPSPDNGEGLFAARFAVVRIGAMQKASQSPEKQQLMARKEQLEGEIDKLKYQKAAMPAEVYRKQLQTLLVELARVQEEIEK